MRRSLTGPMRRTSAAAHRKQSKSSRRPLLWQIAGVVSSRVQTWGCRLNRKFSGIPVRGSPSGGPVDLRGASEALVLGTHAASSCDVRLGFGIRRPDPWVRSRVHVGKEHATRNTKPICATCSRHTHPGLFRERRGGGGGGASSGFLGCSSGRRAVNS